MPFEPSSKDRSTNYDLGRFPDDTLFHRLARAVCHAGCLPRKELFEAWETARRVRRVCRGGRAVDIGGGHGLLAHAMLLLDDSFPEAVVVDTTIPPSRRDARQPARDHVSTAAGDADRELAPRDVPAELLRRAPAPAAVTMLAPG